MRNSVGTKPWEQNIYNNTPGEILARQFCKREHDKPSAGYDKQPIRDIRYDTTRLCYTPDRNGTFTRV